jgi:hypothetical protein
MDSRFVMMSDWYKDLFPDSQLKRGANLKSKFLTINNGFRFATSVGGSVTGEGGDYLIIDDPHNPTQIHSEKFRNRAIEWFEQSFATRLNDKNEGVIVLVMQRLHEDDISGYLEQSGDWEVLKIPIFANHDLEYKINNKEYLFTK